MGNNDLSNRVAIAKEDLQLWYQPTTKSVKRDRAIQSLSLIFSALDNFLLTQPRLLTIEQLKSYDGAVWLVCHHWQGWALPCHSPIDERINFLCRNGYEGVISRAVEDYDSDSKWNFLCYTTKQI